jgi:UDP-N-acetylenolpyruvoylglucosamine reductase
VNQGGARAHEVLDLAAQIKEKALEQRGVMLEMEVKVLGEEQPLPL